MWPLGIPSRGDSGHDATLRHAAAEPRSGRAEEGRRHRGAQRLGSAALVEAAGVAASQPVSLAAHWHGLLTMVAAAFFASAHRLARCYRPDGRVPLGT